MGDLYVPYAEALAALGLTEGQLKGRAARGSIARRRGARGEWLYDVRGSERRKPKMDTPRAVAPVSTIVGLFDVHVPHHDRPTWRVALEVIRDIQPDEIVIGGDFLDVESMSAYADGGKVQLSDEVAAGRRAIRALRDAAGDAKITYIEGNHESRPRRLAAQRLSQVADLLSIDQLLGLSEQGIDWLPEGRSLQRGHLRFIHGYFCGEHHSKQHLERYNWPGVVYGHTHRPQFYTRADGDNRIRAAWGMPCMEKIDPSWLRGKPSGWVNGFGVIYIDGDGDFSVYPVLVFGGKTRFNGRVYDGRRV